MAAVKVRTADSDPPKLFISYSWTTPEHEAWVLRLATELVESGVDVKLDKWELREGHDVLQFMESPVSDASLKKVAMVCDKAYVEKANGRSGGVGKETQVITPKIYDEHRQTKFVALVRDSDALGSAIVPTYYGSRMHIDFRDDSLYSEKFDQLLRWVFDKPLHVRPTIGKPPAFLSSDDRIVLQTAASSRRAIDSLRNSKASAEGNLAEYFALFIGELEKFRISGVSHVGNDFDDRIVQSISDMDVSRREMVQVLQTIAQYRFDEAIVRAVHDLFEGLIPYAFAPKNHPAHTDFDFDNFRFLGHELFLYAIGFLLKHERFSAVVALLDADYYAYGAGDYGRTGLTSFVALDEDLRSFAYRNRRLELNRASLRADLLKERASGTGLEFDHLMQADVFCFLRSAMLNVSMLRWWPDTLVYWNSSSAFEVFARASSRRYFERMKLALGISIKEDLAPILADMQQNPMRMPGQFGNLNVRSLISYDALATRD